MVVLQKLAGSVLDLGNNLNNTIIGNFATNFIVGNEGDDTLAGGAEATIVMTVFTVELVMIGCMATVRPT
jgi:Ca2+-binding RTX toxin-like protein